MRIYGGSKTWNDLELNAWHETCWIWLHLSV